MDTPAPPTALDLDRAVLSVLRARGPLTIEDIAEATGTPSYTVNLALERLGRHGRAVRIGRTARRSGGGWGGTRWLTIWGAAQDPN